jgi:hypothetical protein
MEVITGQDVSLTRKLTLGVNIACAKSLGVNTYSGIFPAGFYDMAPVVTAGVDGATIVKYNSFNLRKIHYLEIL